MAESNEDSTKRTPMTDEQRMELAAKLDRELDEYIDGLERRPYSEGWPEDRWQEEMEKHPFFMTKSPEPGQGLSPLLEGIQQLKYDEADNSPEELAATYKEDGNFYFKCHKYRVAVMSYTEGLHQKCADTALNSQLFNNRAAAHFFLKNYRSCLNDCRSALRLQTPYPKVQFRAAQCCHLLGLHDECIQFCDEILSEGPTDKQGLELRAKAVLEKKVQEKNKRKKAAADHKTAIAEQELLRVIEKRGIRVVGQDGSSLSLSSLEPQCPEGIYSRVHLSEGHLVWPVIFLYPEYQTTDFVQEFHENCTFISQLRAVFETRPEWDLEHKYNPDQLQVYFEDTCTGRLCTIDKNLKLWEALVHPKYTVRGGTPSFIIFVIDSEAERRMLDT